MYKLFKVLSYSVSGDFHRCEDEKGEVHFLDLRISGKIKNSTNENLVGRSVWISMESINPYISIANSLYLDGDELPGSERA